MKYFIVLVIVMISNTFLGVAKPMKNQAEIYFAEDVSGEQNISWNKFEE